MPSVYTTSASIKEKDQRQAIRSSAFAEKRGETVTSQG
jgi:hypothetical protein